MKQVLSAMVGLFLCLGLSGEVWAQDDGEGEPDPYGFVIVDQEARPLNVDDFRKAIGYPAAARDREIQGKVIVRILVTKEGAYKKHLLLNDTIPVLTAAVVEKLPMLEFTPAIKDGQSVPLWVTMPFDFKLAGGGSSTGSGREILREDPHNAIVDGLEALYTTPSAWVSVVAVKNEGLKKLPQAVFDCTNAGSFFLSGNALKKVPADFRKLTSMVALDLENNELKDVPDWLLDMDNLVLVFLAGNPIPEERQAEILQQHPEGVYFYRPTNEEVKAYLESL